MNEDIIIREMSISDDTNKTARLICETAPGLFIALFGGREKAVAKIEILVKLENNIFSYRNILIAEKGGNIRGILIGYDAASVNKEDMNKDIKTALPFFARLRFWAITRFSRHIMDYSDINGCYIQDLCVAPADRGKRIGYRLLDHYIAGSRKKGVKNIYLDVDSKNVTALNLYTAMKFEAVRKIKIKIAGITLYRMRRVV